MKILSHQNINLHSESNGELVYVPKGLNREVPDDVQNHPQFDILVKAGILAVLDDDSESTYSLKKEHEPNDPVDDFINGSPRQVYIDAAEHRAKILFEKQKYIDELETKLGEANKRIDELEEQLEEATKPEETEEKE